MAQKGTRKRRPKSDESSPKEDKFFLQAETKKGIAVIILFALAFIFFLSLLDVAGSVGDFIDTGLRYLFGWGKVFIPILLAVLGYLLLFPEKYQVRTSNYIGLFLLVLSYSGLMHLTYRPEESLEAISSGKGGGYFGLILAWPLQKMMGGWATLVVLIALLIIALLVMFNTTLARLAKGGVLKNFFNRLSDFINRIRYSTRFKKDELPQEGEGISEPEFQKKEMAGSENGAEKEGPIIVAEEKNDEGQMAIFPGDKHKIGKIDLPIHLLNSNGSKPTSGDIRANLEKIKRTLENFGIPVEMGDVNVGPTVTQYTLRPSQGIKLSQITTLQNDLSLALAAHPLRIEAPIPGKSLVGIEVPNQTVAIVGLREVLVGEDFKKRKSSLMIPLGKDVSGKSRMANLDSMPHLLIAGATGSGKSVCINAVIISLLYQNSPNDLRLILVDPKRVEFTVYNKLPHLLTPVITETDKTVNALKWIVREMDNRFRVLSDAGKRNIHSYNATSKEKMPFIVLVIDELADLMSVAANEVEAAITRLAQMARAVGIHLIVATQRPSVDVITGLIKANITARIAFSVASLVDSRTILDHSGAEKLLGRGDMLYSSSDISQPRRYQGAFLADEEIRKVVEYISERAKPDFHEEVLKKEGPAESSEDFDLEEDEELLQEAKDVILRAGKASASLLQRRLRIGYARAARVLDILEEHGFIGPADGAKPREILEEAWEKKASPAEEVEENNNQAEETEEETEEKTEEKFE
ncbi:MAG: DNA translocase FtsK 4TM domain-containing protein [Patescibacteria group bacterium]